MQKRTVSADVKAGGKLRLPKSVSIVPDTTLSDEELAELARLSKRYAGRRTFHSAETFLKHIQTL